LNPIEELFKQTSWQYLQDEQSDRGSQANSESKRKTHSSNNSGTITITSLIDSKKDFEAA
jgi:hypothetical protein